MDDLLDNYLLLQKSSSELFITTLVTIKSNHEPLEISDYHKLANNFAGYGYSGQQAYHTYRT